MKTYQSIFIFLVTFVCVGYILWGSYRQTEINKSLQSEIDSLKGENLKIKNTIDSLKVIEDSLNKINDSLKYSDPTIIYTEIQYRYGKEINAINAGSLNDWLALLFPNVPQN